MQMVLFGQVKGVSDRSSTSTTIAGWSDGAKSTIISVVHLDGSGSAQNMCGNLLSLELA